jgi:hypothetical protein
MLWIPLGLGLALGGAGGCSCRPINITGDDDDDNVDQTDDTFTTTETGDTGPEPPCAAPEIEANNSPDAATLLPMEQRGCGAIDPQFDADYWSFTLEDDGWLTVEAEAGSGSIANMTFLLEPVELFDPLADDSWSASRADGRETLDASLTFLAPAGIYSLLVTEQEFEGGSRHGYDVLVTESKPPVEPWSRVEVEANDYVDEAEPISAGDVVYGTMDGNGALNDSDWYSVTIPAGRHLLHVDIEAYDVGSSADLSVYFWDANLEALPLGCKQVCGTAPGCIPCEIKGGNTAADYDPEGTYDSLGAEVVYIQVTAAKSCAGSGQPCPDGPANWYTLWIDLEET